jgi:hypothetical protein
VCACACVCACVCVCVPVGRCLRMPVFTHACHNIAATCQQLRAPHRLQQLPRCAGAHPGAVSQTCSLAQATRTPQWQLTLSAALGNSPRPPVSTHRVVAPQTSQSVTAAVWLAFLTHRAMSYLLLLKLSDLMPLPPHATRKVVDYCTVFPRQYNANLSQNYSANLSTKLDCPPFNGK